MHLDQERSDGELLSAAAAGDGAAFASFYRRHLPGVVAHLLRETGDREASADLTAEVFAAVFLVAHRFVREEVVLPLRGYAGSPRTSFVRAGVAGESKIVPVAVSALSLRCLLIEEKTLPAHR
jgi:hypothetical protein